MNAAAPDGAPPRRFSDFQKPLSTPLRLKEALRRVTILKYIVSVLDKILKKNK
jgi:hypothetical protein